MHTHIPLKVAAKLFCRFCCSAVHPKLLPFDDMEVNRTYMYQPFTNIHGFLGFSGNGCAYVQAVDARLLCLQVVSQKWAVAFESLGFCEFLEMNVLGKIRELIVV